MASGDTPTDVEEEVQPNKGGGMLGLVLPPVLAGAAAFGVSYFGPLPGMAGAPATEMADTDKAYDDNGATEKSDDAYGDGHDKEKKDDAYAAAGAKPKTLPTLIGEDGGDKKKKKKGKDEAPGLALLKIEPIVISLSQETGGPRRAPRLRMVIAVEAFEDYLTDPAVIQLKLRDGFTAAARALPPETLGGPEGLEALRLELLTAAKDMLGEDAVSAILITDYLMT